MSKAIIAPRSIASTTALPVDIDFSPSPIAAIRLAIGGPSASSISTPTKSDVTIGITRIGMIGLTYLGTGMPLTPFTIQPATSPIRIAPRKPAWISPERYPPMNPGTSPGFPAIAYAM